MPKLWPRIRAAIEQGRYVIGVHAAVQLRYRRIPIWQAVGASLEATLLVERLNAKPNPIAEVEILLPDGSAAKAVWSWLPADSSAKLVTVHFFDR